MFSKIAIASVASMVSADTLIFEDDFNTFNFTNW